MVRRDGEDLVHASRHRLVVGTHSARRVQGAASDADVPTTPYQVGSRYYLPVKIRNVGGETREEVRLPGSVTDPSGGQEATAVVIDLLARGGPRRGVAAFRGDPPQGQVQGVVVSYLEP